MSVCIERAFIGRHFEGTLAPRDERAMREHLKTCGDCRRFYERHLLLARLDPEALSPEDRIGRGLGIRKARSRWVTWAAASTTTVAAAAAALVFLAHGTRDAGFTARGAGLSTTASESQVFVYDVRGRPRALLSGDTIGRGDELALAYENGAGKKRLMVFAVDEHRHVYWFYPAWQSERDDPAAVTIASDATRHELPDAVRHTFDGGKVDLHALFLDTPTTVKQVEALVAQQADLPSSLPGTVECTTALAIAP
jgi:hypothetical protein